MSMNLKTCGELDPCPFCGKTDELGIVDVADRRWHNTLAIKCWRCNIAVSTGYAGGMWGYCDNEMQRLGNKWNTRNGIMELPNDISLYGTIRPCYSCGSENIAIVNTAEREWVIKLGLRCQDCDKGEASFRAERTVHWFTTDRMKKLLKGWNDRYTEGSQN